MTPPDQLPPTGLPDDARSLTPLIDSLESFEERATIYVRGIVWTRFEATWVRVFRARRAQYADAFHVQFKPRGKRNIRQIVEDYKPSAISSRAGIIPIPTRGQALSNSTLTNRSWLRLAPLYVIWTSSSTAMAVATGGQSDLRPSR